MVFDLFAPALDIAYTFNGNSLVFPRRPQEVFSFPKNLHIWLSVDLLLHSLRLTCG